MARFDRRLVLVIGVALALISGTAARGDLELRFDVRTAVVPDPEANPAGPPRKTEAAVATVPIRVVLGAERMLDEQQGIVWVHDFGTRRLLKIDRAAKQYLDDSLFQELGFRVMELQNRIGLAAMLESGKTASRPLPIVLSEHQFALVDPRNKAKIDRTATAEMVTFSWERKPLCAFSTRVVPAGPEDRARFVQFVRYGVRCHPRILEALSALDGIPERLVVTQIDGGKTTTTTLDLKAHAQVAAPAVRLDGLERGVHPWLGEPLRQLVRKARSEGPRDHARRAGSVTERYKRALADGKALGAFVAFVEYGLMTETPMPGLDPARLRTLIAADPDVGRLSAALKPAENADAAARAVGTLEALHEKVDERDRHVLKIFEANLRAAQGEEDRAEALFVEALTVNPSIVGAWKDLGDSRFRRYDTFAAWMCWDIARAIDPAHPCLRPVLEFEARLVKDHPEFFATGVAGGGSR